MNDFMAQLLDPLSPMLEQFHFLRPLWLLVLVPALAMLLVFAWRDDVRRRWQGTIAPHLLDALVVDRRRRWSIQPVHLTVAMLALGAVAMAGPTWRQELPPFLEEKAPLAIAIDLGRSMDAIDVSPTRLERAKLKVKALLDRRDGARTALYAYAGSTHLVMPLTDDSKLLQTFVDALQTRIMPAQGKDTALALKTISDALAKEDTPGTILFITDGVEPSAIAAFKAQAEGDGALPVVLGVGTTQGGPVRQVAADGSSAGGGFAQGPGGQRLFARLDMAALNRLKSEADIPLATLTPDSDDDVRWVQRHVQSHLAQKQAETHARWKDEGWWLCIPIALLSALWFRKGWTVRWAAGVLLAWGLTAQPIDSMAAEPAASAASAAVSASPTQGLKQWWMDLWLTRDQQGRLAFDRGDYASAAAQFDDPMWRGIALYRAGRYRDAVQSFALVDSAESNFNQGNALAHQGQFVAAVQRYSQALVQRPNWPEATANLALVKGLIPPDKKDDDDDDDQENKPNKGDEIKFDGKDEKGKQQTLVATRQSADTWMRAIQTSPTDLLARQFQLQHQQPKAAPASPTAPAAARK